MMRVGNLIGGVVVAAALTGLGVEAPKSFRDAGPAPVAASGTVRVSTDIAGFAFAPVRIAAGGEVTWRNTDAAPHSVEATDKSFASAVLAKDGVFTQRFDTPGIFTYVCGIHGSMRGTVEVGTAGSVSAGSVSAGSVSATSDPYTKG